MCLQQTKKKQNKKKEAQIKVKNKKNLIIIFVRIKSFFILKVTLPENVWYAVIRGTTLESSKEA